MGTKKAQTRLQHNVPSKRQREKTDKTGLLLRIQPLEKHGHRRQSKVGPIFTPFWPTFRSWIFERHVTLANKKRKTLVKVRLFFKVIHGQPVMAQL